MHTSFILCAYFLLLYLEFYFGDILLLAIGKEIQFLQFARYLVNSIASLQPERAQAHVYNNKVAREPVNNIQFLILAYGRRVGLGLEKENSIWINRQERLQTRNTFTREIHLLAKIL